MEKISTLKALYVNTSFHVSLFLYREWEFCCRKHLLNSPLLSRKQRKSKTTESSDDEIIQSGDEVFNGKNYRDLESFQKAQLRQKVSMFDKLLVISYVKLVIHLFCKLKK